MYALYSTVFVNLVHYSIGHMFRIMNILCVAAVLLFQGFSCFVTEGDDLAHLKAELSQERQARYVLEARVNELESTVDHFSEGIDTECSVQCPADPSVAFMAQMSKPLNNPAIGHVILYDQVHTNDGNAYSPIHGVFTAPVNGTYNFDLIASATQGTADHAIHLFIMKNGVEAGYVFMDYNTQYAVRRTTDVTVRLTKGDEIWVQVTAVQGANVSLYGGGFHNHFSGFLIHSD